MARLPRLVLPGIPYHVTQRGNRREQTFFEEDDYTLYRDKPASSAARAGAGIRCYCLMPNHVHVIGEARGLAFQTVEADHARQSSVGAAMKALLLAAGMATAIAATAQPARAPPEAQTPKAQSDEPSRVVCVESAEIGSRLRQRRVCRTRAQWAEYRQDIRTKVARIQVTGEAPGE